MPDESKIDATYWTPCVSVPYLGASVVFSCLKNEHGVKQKHFRSPAMRTYRMGENKSERQITRRSRLTYLPMNGTTIQTEFFAVCSNNARSQFFCCKLTLAQCTPPFQRNAVPEEFCASFGKFAALFLFVRATISHSNALMPLRLAALIEIPFSFPFHPIADAFAASHKLHIHTHGSAMTATRTHHPLKCERFVYISSVHRQNVFSLCLASFAFRLNNECFPRFEFNINRMRALRSMWIIILFTHGAREWTQSMQIKIVHDINA